MTVASLPVVSTSVMHAHKGSKRAIRGQSKLGAEDVVKAGIQIGLELCQVAINFAPVLCSKEARSGRLMHPVSTSK